MSQPYVRVEPTFDDTWPRVLDASTQGQRIRSRKRSNRGRIAPVRWIASIFSALSLCFVGAGWIMLTNPQDSAGTPVPEFTSDAPKGGAPGGKPRDSTGTPVPEFSGDVGIGGAPDGVALYFDTDSLAAASVGTVRWSAITKENHPSVQARLAIPALAATVSVTFSRNHDETLDASYLAEIRFVGEFSRIPIREIPALLLKQTERGVGKPLAGVPVKITEDFFWFALSSNADEQAYNLELLRNGSWFEIPIVLADQTQIRLTFEKDNLGGATFEDRIDGGK